MTKTGVLMASSIFRGKGVLWGPKGCEYRTDRAHEGQCRKLAFFIRFKFCTVNDRRAGG